MIGFVNTNKEKRDLGGEIVQAKRRAQRITWSIVGVIVLALFILILNFVAKI